MNQGTTGKVFFRELANAEVQGVVHETRGLCQGTVYRMLLGTLRPTRPKKTLCGTEGWLADGLCGQCWDAACGKEGRRLTRLRRAACRSCRDALPQKRETRRSTLGIKAEVA